MLVRGRIRDLRIGRRNDGAGEQRGDRVRGVDVGRAESGSGGKSGVSIDMASSEWADNGAGRATTGGSHAQGMPQLWHLACPQETGVTTARTREYGRELEGKGGRWWVHRTAAGASGMTCSVRGAGYEYRNTRGQDETGGRGGERAGREG